ncbi:hypothetical protein GQ43DRAFT_469616 [Delitschia confertaspora ATCC 74209]|uniref:DRBM domain-containing protein n=1 Tax=Delitschia confertaspora ATCC 74209 TaxID=1513339 RepID=A0A9P4JWH3_9PLEO|nr:hypothetical protein GQ43DRAFT_469616 [Delitschia confertaspora ATCC 74209]
MAQYWQNRLKDHCTTARLEQPTWQDVSDRRGGRTAWSSIAVVQGRAYSARFWYDGAYVEQAREDAAEIAYLAICGNQPSSPTTTTAATTYYAGSYTA